MRHHLLYASIQSADYSTHSSYVVYLKTDDHFRETVVFIIRPLSERTVPTVSTLYYDEGIFLPLAKQDAPVLFNWLQRADARIYRPKRKSNLLLHFLNSYQLVKLCSKFPS